MPPHRSCSSLGASSSFCSSSEGHCKREDINRMDLYVIYRFIYTITCVTDFQERGKCNEQTYAMIDLNKIGTCNKRRWGRQMLLLFELIVISKRKNVDMSLKYLSVDWTECWEEIRLFIDEDFKQSLRWHNGCPLSSFSLSVRRNKHCSRLFILLKDG